MPDFSPSPATPDVRLRMQRQARRDTAPELAIRRKVHARGLRYRVDARPVKGLRRTADLVFGRDRVAVFVDGCFWHACPEHGSIPKSNAGWWRAKFEGTRARDRETDELLAYHGWLVLRIWEHESANEAADRIWDAVTTRRS
jgi:DNA mismatch endonuclease, patch repair protein